MSRVIIVTGLPRSGTSLLMQMLDVAGVPILADEHRPPDEDNPRGYFEFGPVKRLDREQGWLDDARGKAVKIVAPLLPHLPSDLPCDVVFVERALDEVLASQAKMMARRGLPAPSSEEDLVMRGLFAKSLEAARLWMDKALDTRILSLQHATMVSRPREAATAIESFLGLVGVRESMANIVDQALYRNRC